MIDPNKANCYYLMMALQMLALEQMKGNALSLDPNDEQCMKSTFAAYILPWLKALPVDCQQAFRVTLAYYLKGKDFPHVTWMAQGLSLDDPDDEHLMFTWLWDVLFPGSRPDEIDTSKVIEDDDIMGINRIQGSDLPDEYFKIDE